VKLARHLIVLFVLLCLIPDAPAFQVSDTVEAARQMAAAVDDNAAGLEERKSALKKLKEAASLFESAGETVEAARVLNRAGRLQFLLSAPKDAIDSHRQALALLKRRPDVQLEVDALNGLGATYLLVQNKKSAEEALLKARSLSERAGYKEGQAQALLTLSDLQNYDDHALALQTAQASLALWQALGDKQGLARAYAQVGRCNMAQNILQEATRNYEQSLALWRELNDASAQAGVLIMLAYIEIRKGEWQGSIQLLTQAQSLLDGEAEPVKMGQVAGGLADAFNESGLPETGIIHYRKALDYYRLSQDPHLIRYATGGIGWSYYLMGDYANALTYLQQALEGADKQTLEAASIYEYLGRVYAATGQYAEGLSYLRPALAVFTRSANPKEAARTLAMMGQIYQQQGELEPARRTYRQALESFNKLSDRLNQAAVLSALGRLELRSGNYDAAEDYLRQSIEATENIRRIPTTNDLTAAFSASVHDRYESYIECLMRKAQLQPAAGLTIRAFEISELARARSLAEMLQATGTILAIPDAQLAAEEKSLRQSLRVKENYKVALLGNSSYDRAALDALNEELARLEAQYRQVMETIRARYPSYERITRPVAWDLRRIQEQVIADDDTVLLEYSLGAEKSYAWVVSRSGMTGYEIASRALINEAAQRVYKLLENPPGAATEVELREATENLGRLILSPVAQDLKRRRVVIVPDGALNYIPFQILPSPSALDEPFVTTHEIVNAPSASILGQLREETARREAPAKVLAAFGDPVFASNYAQRKEQDGEGEQAASLPEQQNERYGRAVRDLQLSGDKLDPSLIQPLFYARRELSNLGRVVSGDAIVMAAGFDATRERLQSTDLTKFAILHFATHGFLDPVRPENSGLMLSTINRNGQAQEGYLGLHDIYGLRAPVDLVVLSACRTALGKEVRGEGLIGLTRGFMHAGASSVVASLWKVDDEATAELMKRFYGNMLQGGMRPAEALRAAQNSIRQEPQWRSPYYWAAFTLQGEYHSVIKIPHEGGEDGWLRKLVPVVAALLLLCGLVWWYLRRMRTA
jgi:CHAT domain-containing protein